MRAMSKEADLNILDEIIKLAEGSMAGNVTKKKPDLSVMKVSIDGKKEQPESGEEESEGEDYSLGMAKDKMMAKTMGDDEGCEEKPNFDDMELEDLIEEYKKMKG